MASHVSAAVVHGLPVWEEDLDRVQLTRDRAGGGRRGERIRVHGTPLPVADVLGGGAELDGVRVTGLARTVVDLARQLPAVRSVAAGDVALARLGDIAPLHAQLDLAAGRTGGAAARRAVAWLDPRSESPGESYSRVVLRQAGVPAPELQFEVRDERGRLVGRSDFAWPELGVLGEFDGRAKYEALLVPGQTGADALFAEKVREDRLRDLGWQVVRWIWRDLRDPAELLARLDRAFRRARR